MHPCMALHAFHQAAYEWATTINLADLEAMSGCVQLWCFSRTATKLIHTGASESVWLFPFETGSVQHFYCP